MDLTPRQKRYGTRPKIHLLAMVRARLRRRRYLTELIWRRKSELSTDAGPGTTANRMQSSDLDGNPLHSFDFAVRVSALLRGLQMPVALSTGLCCGNSIDARSPCLALFGTAVTSDLSPECAPKRTFADHSGFIGSRPSHFPRKPSTSSSYFSGASRNTRCPVLGITSACAFGISSASDLARSALWPIFGRSASGAAGRPGAL
jgi:hypothetical protein